MSSTNKTTNYELSQFVGSDKPAWLADYNSDMGKIDAGMKGNADAITVTDGKADTNATNIGTLANLNTTAKTDIVSAVNEVYTTAGTASSTATQTAIIANGAKTEADALANYLSITSHGTINITVTGGTLATGYTDGMKYGLNAAGTLGKIYGRLRFRKTTSGVTTITFPISGLNVDSSFTINSACFWYWYNNQSNSFSAFNFRDIQVNTNGTITFEIPNTPNVGDDITIWFPPCLYFFTDFGDINNPTN